MHFRIFAQIFLIFAVLAVAVLAAPAIDDDSSILDVAQARSLVATNSDESDLDRRQLGFATCYHQSILCDGGKTDLLYNGEQFKKVGSCVAIKPRYNSQLCNSCPSDCQNIEEGQCYGPIGSAVTQGCVKR